MKECWNCLSKSIENWFWAVKTKSYTHRHQSIRRDMTTLIFKVPSCAQAYYILKKKLNSLLTLFFTKNIICQFICLFSSDSIYLSFYLSHFLGFLLTVSIYLSIYLTYFLGFHLSVFLYLSINLYIYLFRDCILWRELWLPQPEKKYWLRMTRTCNCWGSCYAGTL